MTNLPTDPNSRDHSELTDRLGALGTTPVDPAVASAHLTAIASVRTANALRPARARFVRAKVVAAFAAGLVLGGTGLASAGALGSTPQNAVADAATHVGLDLPGGTPRSTVGCGGQTYKNHGQFVAQGGDPHSPCGKPLKSTAARGKSDDTNTAPGPKQAPGKKKASGKTPDEAPDAGDNHGCGRPPWAGKGNHAKKTPAAVAAHRAACGDDGADSDATTTTAGAPTP